jgi:putative phosphoribosyl transferase
MPFHDRHDAGRRLAAALAGYSSEACVVLALPRGGVPVGAEVAEILHAPFGLVLVRKIGVPHQPELAMGAVVDGAEPLIVRNLEIISLAGISEAAFEAACARELQELARRRALYLGNRATPNVHGKVAIVVDDGIATGATTRAALRAVRHRHPRKLVLAVPVAPPDTLRELADEADEIVCLEQHASFGALGQCYDDFRQVADHEVIETLARFAPLDRPSGKASRAQGAHERSPSQSPA